MHPILAKVLAALAAAILCASLVVSVANAQVIPPARGGTGTSTAPANGQLLIGNAGGTWDYIASSTLSSLLNYWAKSGTHLYYTGGDVGIGTSSPLTRLNVQNSENSAGAILVSGSSKGVRIGTTVDGGVVEGVDYTGFGSYQPLQVGGSEVDIHTSGTLRMRVASSGNVGIGIASPTSLLHVKSPTGDGIARIEGVDNNHKGKLYLSSTASGDGGIQYDASNNTMDLFSYSTMKFNVGTGNVSGAVANERMRITQDGYVGIGVSSPSYRLTVGDSTTSGVVGRFSQTGTGSAVGIYVTATGSGTQNTAGYFEASGAGTNVGLTTVVAAAANNYSFYGAGTAQSYFGGNVGIGITSPSTRLDVAGTITAQNQLDIWGNNGFLSGSITANSAGGGLYLAAAGTDQNIRLVPTGTGFVQTTSPLVMGGNILLDGNWLSGDGNDEGVFVSSNGNVGIGTSTPSDLLHLSALSGTDTPRVHLTNGTTGYGASDGSYFGVSNGNEFVILKYESAPLRLFTSGNERLTITSSGNVGIGTSTPGAKLDLFSTATTTLRLDSNAADKGSCLVMKDSDGSGYSYITVADGVMTVSTLPCS